VPALSSVCVFCGCNGGADPAYLAAARTVGRTLAARGLRLVYGGADVGMMGALAGAALEAGGDVVGVIARPILDRVSDAFVALPGGITFEELFEVFTWAHLGLHRKPLGLLDVAGYYAPLEAMLDHAVQQRFLRPETRAMLVCDDSLDALLERFDGWDPPRVPKWIDRDAT
jgi:predicted Rossmann-fold nucleotide-binding protein